MFKNKFFVSFVLVLVFLLLFGVSSVSADEYYFSSSNITNDSFQGVIDNSTPDEVIINLDDGEYSLGQINITRNATIVGNSSGNVKINGSGILFNITSSNVKLINLTITGYTSAIVGNSSDLTVTSNNITTGGISINISSSGGNLSNIVIEDNFIVSSVSDYNYGAVFVNANGMAISFVSFINNSIRGNGTSSSNGVRINSKGINNLTFDGNNITGTSYGVYLEAYSSNYTNTNITFANNNITGTSYGVYLEAYSSNNTNITFANNNITVTGYNDGVYLYAYGSNNTNITFANNNITGTSRGVYLYVSSSNNTDITFANNNITATSSYDSNSVYLYAGSSNNTNITFTNNNNTGCTGVRLEVASSNNTNITFANNNFTGTASYNGYGVYLVAGNSNNTNIFFTNNNITGTVTSSTANGVYLYAYSSNNTNITFVNNNITGTGVSSGANGVLLSAYGSNNTNITFVNNNITGSSGYGVSLDASSSNNTNIFFTNNNITGSSSNGVRLWVSGSNNTNITFVNNNITGTVTSSNDAHGVYLYAQDSNNTNITFVNNNITGSSSYNGHGVFLSAGSSNNTNITFVNNNITGNLSNGVRLYASSSNNTNIFFTNNNITGKYPGVSLEAGSSNNTNITFTNNNITGTDSNGFSLEAGSSNNTNITFVNNNITGKSGYAVSLGVGNSNNTNIFFTNNNITVSSGNGVNVYLQGGDVSGVMFLNNTINATGGSGFYFANNYLGSPGNVTDFVIRGNNIFASVYGLNFTGFGEGSLVNVTVEYNRIFAPVGVNIIFNDNSSFDYNWWGVNDITGKTLGINTLNHYILNITNLTSLDDLRFGDNVSFAFLLLNTTLVNTGVENLPYFVVNGTYNGQTFLVDNFSNFTGNLTVSQAGNDGNVLNATLDSQDASLTFSASKINTNSTIISPNEIHVGDNAVITGQLANYTGISSVNVTVDGILYSDVVVDSTGGNWSVSHLTNHTGTYNVIVEYTELETGNYTGFTNTSSFEVTKLATNSSINIPGSVNFNQTVLISGVLTDENNNTISGANLEVIVDGESFNVTTDSVGVWGLNYTPEHSGVFNLSLFYQGDSRYVGFVENKVFNVSKLATTSSINIPSNVKVGKSITVSGVLTSGGKPLANTSVLVIVDGKTYKVTTNGLGVWKLSYTLKKAGKSTMKVSFAGNNDYIGFNVSKTFKVTGKVKISIVKISKLVKVGKYRGFNLYSKVYTIKNVGSAVGSKDYVKYFKNWYLEKLSKTSKIVKYQFSAKSRVFKVQVKNLGVGKQVKLKILVTHRKRL
nr:hypothetical protein [Methanobrevibacter arboriphilus]